MKKKIENVFSWGLTFSLSKQLSQHLVSASLKCARGSDVPQTKKSLLFKTTREEE